MPLIVFLMILYLTKRAVEHARADNAYTQRGEVPPRLAARYGEQAAARVPKYGFRHHLRDSYRDMWARRTDATLAARNARTAGGKRRTLRERFRAGLDALYAPPEQHHHQPPPAAPAPQPVQVTYREPAPAGDEPVVDFTDVASVEPPPAAPIPGQWAPTEPGEGPSPATTTAPTLGGNPMTAPATGEAINLEMATEQLRGLITDLQTQVDAGQVAVNAIGEAEAAVDAMQLSYRPAADAAATKLEHLQAAGLDATTLTHAANTVEALPVEAVDGLYERLEEVKVLAQERVAQAEAAKAAAEAELSHLITTYSDAHETIAANLGGRSGFLDSSGT